MSAAGPGMLPRLATPFRRLTASLGMVGLVTGLASCQSGIGPDIERQDATETSYETRVADLERELRDQQATFAVFTPLAATPTPIPFDERWQIEIAGPVEVADQLGVRDDLTPIAADGTFLVVPIEIENLTDRPLPFSAAGRLELVNADDQVFSLDSRATGAAYLVDRGYDPSFAAKQPGITYPDVLVFDVPNEAASYVLHATDDSLSLPLTVTGLGTPAP